MTLRFSDAGPEFPRPLIDAMIDGDVVFLCGAGVSAPQLPGFQKLVEDTYRALDMDRDRSEDLSFKEGRYEEVLGALGRRLADSPAMEREVVRLLQIPDHPFLGNHETILRLSRDLNNRPMVVTTNFDNLFELALHSADPSQSVRNESVAGQALPAPGSLAFRGIIHLHGRLEDPTLELEKTPLVLTSADYGDAYMRSGWASRFLFDLVRCKTVVLLGYRAGDAPVRYFLNVLAADRARFADLKQVYAFDAVVSDVAEADARWTALAVEPLAYTATTDIATGAPDHRALWNDLAQLANVIERPKLSRRTMAEDILTKAYSDSSETEQKALIWLFRDRTDLRDILIAALTDPLWFKFMREHDLIPDIDLSWIIPAWIARDFESYDRLEVALRWQALLSPKFNEHLSNRLRDVKSVSPLWLRAWRLIADVDVRPDGFDLTEHQLIRTLRSDVVLDADLRGAVSHLAPLLELQSSRKLMASASRDEPPVRVADIVWPDMALRDSGELHELIEVLTSRADDADRLMDLATEALRSTIATSVDAGMIVETWDSNDQDVPSVEDHSQNDHHGGVIGLVRLLINLLPNVARQSREHARDLARDWARLPGSVGVRMWLHALRNPDAFSSTEAATGALALSIGDFWASRRELPLLLRDRMGDAAPELVSQLERRIITEGDEYFGRYDLEVGQVDWRDHARDSSVWLRLKMMCAAGALSPDGKAELDAIIGRRDTLNREAEDTDFFGSYSFGVRAVVGDPGPIEAAADEERLEVAQQVIQSRDFQLRDGWSAYCRSDPQGALSTLSGAGWEVANAELWNTFLSALSFAVAQEVPAQQTLRTKTFGHLWAADDDFLALLADRLVDLLSAGSRDGIADQWWDRLWSFIVKAPADAELEKDLLSTAVNRSAGRLTQTLLADIQSRRKANQATDDLVARLTQAATDNGWAGLLASAVMVRDIPFVIAVAPDVADPILVDRTSGDSDHAKALRRVLITYPSVTKSFSKTFAGQILQGSVDWTSDSHSDHVAAKLLLPALRIIRGQDSEDDWGTTVADAAATLRNGHPAIRLGAAMLLRQWSKTEEEDSAGLWRDGLGPLMSRIWPKASQFVSEAVAGHLVAIAIHAKEAFPEAFLALKPYLAPAGHRARGVYALEQSKIPETFPGETLELLWLTCGPRSNGQAYEMASLLDRIVKVRPQLETDRRLQWLELRAVLAR